MPPRMLDASYIVLGATGLIGSAVRTHLESHGETVISVNSKNYAESVGTRAKVLVNCDGNTFRYRANQDPHWDFEASVVTVEQSLFDFQVSLYVYISTVDVYNVRNDPARNHEAYPIQSQKLDAYAFHKWLAERLVEKYATRSVILRVGTALGPGLKKGPFYDLLNAQPLHLPLDSELTFIDTPTIAKALSVIIAMYPMHEIINLTGTGAARLRDLQSKIQSPIQLAPGAEAAMHSYNINNVKMRGIMPIPTSFEIAEKFLNDWARMKL